MNSNAPEVFHFASNIFTPATTSTTASKRRIVIGARRHFLKVNFGNDIVRKT